MANVPIGLGYLDYKKRIGGIHHMVQSSNDEETVMKEITNFYKDINGKHPEKFSPDIRYLDK